MALNWLHLNYLSSRKTLGFAGVTPKVSPVGKSSMSHCLFGVVRKELAEVFHRLASHKKCHIEEGHVMPDHVHMLGTSGNPLTESKIVRGS